MHLQISRDFFFHISDKDENAKQVFYLNGDNADYFSLDSESGDLKTSAHLDREEISIFNLVAHAQGQIISECPYEMIVCPKIATKKFPRFLS